MEHEVVHRKGWLTRDEFLDLLGTTNLIPGPNSTEMAIHIGWKRARWAGLLVAGMAFILPAAVQVLALAWALERYGRRFEAGRLLYGIKPVIIALVVQALWRLGRQALRTRTIAMIAVLCIALTIAGVNELIVLLGGGGSVALLQWTRRRPESRSPAPVLAPLPLCSLAVSSALAAPFGLMPLFLFFLKVGSVLFGSGYVLLAFLRADLVERWGWLTDSQLLDAVAVGQMTPGPVSTTATFIGYILGGVPGAVLATVGIFLPAFVFVGAQRPPGSALAEISLGGGIPGRSQCRLAGLDGRGHATPRASGVVDKLTILLAAFAGLALWRLPIGTLWLILAGGVIGWIGSALW